MDLSLTRAQQEFREQVRDWLLANVPVDHPPHHDSKLAREFDTAWQRRQYDAGWAGISWPVEHGGRGLSLVEQLIWHEEYARARGPYIGSCFVAVNHAGPTLITSGSQEQRDRHLRRILRGDEIWCQGFSEPGAGSDLAGIQTRAVVEGDELRINGQKIWTSWADVADFQELLVRTDPDAPRHEGISWVICDMTSPGITVRPIEAMDGSKNFCEVFYDDVRLPIDNVVGGLNHGWQVAMTTLSFERGTAFMAEQVALAQHVEDLVAVAKEQPNPRGPGRAIDDDDLARRLGHARASVTSLRAMTYVNVSRVAREGGAPGVMGSVLRLHHSELMQRVCRLAVEVLGQDAILWSPDHVEPHWTRLYMYSYSRTISAGTKDIQRNIIGERMLGLPK